MADLLNLSLHIFTIPFFLILATLVARLHHNNLVKLHGCTTRHSRELLLVYEFIPNGTVADHLHGNQKESGILSWDMRMKIATESASALSYLHASDIIHRDVKTNNILLDNHFSVKVADFGLSRLFPFETTHVSTAPQGTPGYLDPDYNKCYQVTNKSDVYSFGVVLVELISSLPKNSWRVSFVTEIYSNSTIVDRWCIEFIFVKTQKCSCRISSIPNFLGFFQIIEDEERR